MRLMLRLSLKACRGKVNGTGKKCTPCPTQFPWDKKRSPGRYCYSFNREEVKKFITDAGLRRGVGILYIWFD